VKKVFPWGLAAISLVLFVLAVWKAAHPLVVLTTWKTTQANILNKEFYHSHNSDGFLTYGTELTIHYDAGGHAHEIKATSANLPTEFPEPFKFYEALRTDVPIQIRYDPANPEKVEFDTTLRLALPYLFAALVCGLAIIPARRLLRPKRRCGQCNIQLESYWRYCAECGEPLRAAKSSPSPASPQHSPADRSTDSL
jgi:hypothetical protein